MVEFMSPKTLKCFLLFSTSCASPHSVWRRAKGFQSKSQWPWHTNKYKKNYTCTELLHWCGCVFTFNPGEKKTWRHKQLAAWRVVPLPAGGGASTFLLRSDSDRKKLILRLSLVSHAAFVLIIGWILVSGLSWPFRSWTFCWYLN